MKDFLKMTLAVIVGLMIVSAITTFLTFGIIAAVSAAGKATTQVPKDAVLKIDLSSMVLAEQTQDANPFESIQSKNETRIIGIWDAINTLNTAAQDPNVKLVYLKTDGNTSDVAHLQEFRKALANFRSSGKAVISYIEAPSTGSYYLSSVSDKVYMTSHPGATTMVSGVSSQMIFLKDLLDKLGVNVQLIRHGKYKSAGEMFVRNSSSEENLLQQQVMINSIWNSLATEIAASRDITVDELNAAIDGLRLVEPEDFVNEKLVDEVLTRNELKEKLTTFAMADRFDKVNFVSFPDYLDSKAALPVKISKQIAVIYADGDIVDGDDIKNVAGDRFAGIIAKVRADSTVKAVVLRVNSPGGSVIASDKIKAELDLLKKDKPLIASYGSYAASGGYWISNNCTKIYSDATTLTGSIGVFSMIPDFSKTVRNIAHINVTSVSSNKHGDMMSLMRPLDKDEQAYMLRSVEDIYEKFVSTVSEGRHMEKDFVDNIGQGRVWTGSDALAISLVDEIGGIEDAIRYAAICGGDVNLANWSVTGYPKPQTTLEMIMEMFNKSNPEENIFAGTILENASATMMKWADMANEGKADLTFARIPYEITIR